MHFSGSGIQMLKCKYHFPAPSALHMHAWNEVCVMRCRGMLQGEGRASAAVKDFMLGEVLPSVTLIFQVALVNKCSTFRKGETCMSCKFHAQQG
jgi:hypothetical protein